MSRIITSMRPYNIRKPVGDRIDSSKNGGSSEGKYNYEVIAF